MSKSEKTPKQQAARVSQGGSYCDGTQYACRRQRYNIDTGCRNNSLGVRLVEVLDE